MRSVCAAGEVNEREQLRRFICDTFFVDDDFADDESLTRTGTVDSLGMMQLVAYVGERINARVPNRDLTPRNFDTVNAIVAYVERKRGN